MHCTATRLTFEETRFFSRIILDYLQQAKALKPFYKHPVSLDGIRASIASREQFSTNRRVLVDVLKSQYAGIAQPELLSANVESLLSANTFTITTAHQPAIFTGNLYFIYKILHVIKLAAWLSEEMPTCKFVPVFYMGSEDADLDELGHIYLDGEKISWNTTQQGAVGRMNTKGLEQIINRIEGEFSGQPFGKTLVALLRECYLNSADIQTATFKLIHKLFGDKGLVVLIPDEQRLKKQMQAIFESDLFDQTPSAVVAKTIARLSASHKVQANPRDINLFYLKDDLRGRIERQGEKFIVHGSPVNFTEPEMRTELQNHPDRFSPNVILRGLFQETILPNIVFVGGGGEMAYWLELKDLMDHYGIPFPVLVLRNSFLVIEKKWKKQLDKTGWPVPAIFRGEEELMNELVRKSSGLQLDLDKEKNMADHFYGQLEKMAVLVDPTLGGHVAALKTRALKPLAELEKKLLRAEKRKFDDQRRQLQSVKKALFPLKNLQERIDNFIPYYAVWGQDFFDKLYENSLTIEQQFVVLTES